jgi:hypothetical protein
MITKWEGKDKKTEIGALVLGLISTMTYNTTPLEKSFWEKIPPPPL